VTTDIGNSLKNLSLTFNNRLLIRNATSSFCYFVTRSLKTKCKSLVRSTLKTVVVEPRSEPQIENHKLIVL